MSNNIFLQSNIINDIEIVTNEQQKKIIEYQNNADNLVSNLSNYILKLRERNLNLVSSLKKANDKNKENREIINTKEIEFANKVNEYENFKSKSEESKTQLQLMYEEKLNQLKLKIKHCEDKNSQSELFISSKMELFSIKNHNIYKMQDVIDSLSNKYQSQIEKLQKLELLFNNNAANIKSLNELHVKLFQVEAMIQEKIKEASNNEKIFENDSNLKEDIIVKLQAKLKDINQLLKNKELQLETLNTQIKNNNRKTQAQEKEITTFIDNNKDFEKENFELQKIVEKKNEELKIYIKEIISCQSKLLEFEQINSKIKPIANREFDIDRLNDENYSEINID